MTERVQQLRRPGALFQRTAAPSDTSVGPEPLALQRQVLSKHTNRPSALQRQVAGPVLRAAAMDRQEQARLTDERQSVRRQIAGLGNADPAFPRQVPGPVPPRPVSPADWVTVLRARAEEVQGRALDARSAAGFTALQRQVAQTLVQGFRAERGPAAERSAQYGEYLATLQRHPVSAPVARVVLGSVPAAERPALQRAVDESLERARAQEQAALNVGVLQTLQRQLAELDAEATRPVWQRIQARRGAGNPLPGGVQRHLEAGLNHDLSRVRIHDDAEADQLAKSVSAAAFTTGTDIFFQAGRFDPNTRSGLELLAHEVTHTVQQSQGRVAGGIDPDAGLEAEARTMGQRLASQPTAARPATSLRSAVTASSQAVQRWGLGDLKKLATGAASRVSAAVHSVRQAAQERVHKAVGQVQRVSAAALQTVKATAKQAGAGVRAVAGGLRRKVQQAGKTVRQYARRTLVQVSRTAQVMNRQARSAALGLARQAGQLKGRAQQAARRVGRLAQASVHRAVSGLTRLRQRAGQSVRHLAAQAQAARKTFVARAGATLVRAKAGAQKLVRQAREQAQRLTATAKRKASDAGALLRNGARQAAKLAVQGWNGAVGSAKAVRVWAADRVRQVRADPRFQRTLHLLQTSGVQILKVGTAIVVGGAVIAGAAALTAATGGLAGPALVAALFASGALGGAASTVVGNLFEKNKNGTGRSWHQGIGVKSLVTDGAMGVVLGPAAKLVGGVVRAAGRPVLSRLGALAAARMPGAVGWVQGATSGVRSAAATLARNAGREVARRWNTLRVGAQPTLATLGHHIGRSLPGRAFKGADFWFSRGVRGLAAQASRGAQWGGRAVKAVSDAARARVSAMPWMTGRARAFGRVTGRLRDNLTLGGLKLRNAAGRGWTKTTTTVRRTERNIRFDLHSRGLPVDPTRSLSARLFNAAERNLFAMRNYVSAEAKVIGGEVRDQWLGSAGMGGVLRTGEHMEKLVARTPSLAAGWRRELAVARSGLLRERGRALQLEARAAGTALSRRAARRQARTLITQDMVQARAVRTVRAPFLKRATDVYAHENRAAQTGFDPSRGILAQLPRAYWTGARQMAADARGRLGTLRQAGGVAGAGAVAGGWLSEEMFKTYLGGAAKAFKNDDQAQFPNRRHLQAGGKEVQGNLLKNAVTAGTGLIPEAQGGRLMIGAPYDRVVKTTAALGGYTAVTDTQELQSPEDDGPAAAAHP